MIVIEHVAGLATIQDLGRPGRMHEGLAPGGALVPELLAVANRLAGNADEAPAIELYGRMRVRAESKLVMASEQREELRAGQELTIESGRWRVAYLAVRGGFAARLVCGGRGAQLSAGIGALLHAGDRLHSADEPTPPRATGGALDPIAGGGPLRLIAGPDVIEGALEVLCAGEYRISAASNRVGTRLDGPRLPAPVGTAVSRPMVRGAIEVPPDGAPIVLGPEHPTTGGYPVIAVVAHADLGSLFARPIGARVRFAISAGAAR